MTRRAGVGKAEPCSVQSAMSSAHSAPFSAMKRAINAMIGDIATLSLAESCRAETGKAQKQELANRISGEGCEANPDWRPGWMQVPPTRLVDGAGSPPADAWTRIASLFEAGAENASDETPEHQDAA